MRRVTTPASRCSRPPPEYSSGGLQLTRSSARRRRDAVPEDRPEDRQVASARLSEAHPLERRLARSPARPPRPRAACSSPDRNEPEIEVGDAADGHSSHFRKPQIVPAVRPNERVADVAVRAHCEPERRRSGCSCRTSAFIASLPAELTQRIPLARASATAAPIGSAAVVAIRALPAHRLVDDGHALALRVADGRERSRPRRRRRRGTAARRAPSRGRSPRPRCRGRLPSRSSPPQKSWVTTFAGRSPDGLTIREAHEAAVDDRDLHALPGEALVVPGGRESGADLLAAQRGLDWRTEDARTTVDAGTAAESAELGRGATRACRSPPAVRSTCPPAASTAARASAGSLGLDDHADGRAVERRSRREARTPSDRAVAVVREAVRPCGSAEAAHRFDRPGGTVRAACARQSDAPPSGGDAAGADASTSAAARATPATTVPRSLS